MVTGIQEQYHRNKFILMKSLMKFCQNIFL